MYGDAAKTLCLLRMGARTQQRRANSRTPSESDGQLSGRSVTGGKEREKEQNSGGLEKGADAKRVSDTRVTEAAANASASVRECARQSESWLCA